MNARTWLLALGLLVVPAIVSAQTTITATFTFGPVDDTYNNACAPILTWNGSTQYGTPEEGAVCWGAGDPDSGATAESYVDIPFELGFANDGYWAGGSAVSWGPIVCIQPTAGCTTTNGGTYTQSGSSGNFYDAPASSLTLFVNFSVTKHTSCRYGRCSTYYTSAVTGGRGIVSETF